MSDTVRCWLAERGYNSRDLIILKYATPDGDRVYRQELSSHVIDSKTVTAAKDVDPDNLEQIEDEETRERYANEVERVASEHDPDDEI